MRGTARYINLRNGEPSGATTDFSSAPITVGGGSDAAVFDGPADGGNSVAGAARRLQQTWGGATRSVNRAPQVVNNAVSPIYSVNGQALLVPQSVADGAGVIVSGATVLQGAGNGPAQGALSAAAGVPVILPSRPNPDAGSMFVMNEAGPADVAAAVASALSGMGDECVDVADTFLVGNGTVAGKLVMGSPPSGRVCKTTTFTYTMRYGPYADCAPRRAVNTATFQAGDSGTRGSASSELELRVEGCASPAGLKVSPLRAVTSAKGGYAWTASKRADVGELALGQDAAASVTYTVDFKRVGAKSGATLVADAAVSNPGAAPVALEAASFTATLVCDGYRRTASGPAVCESMTVPARGKVVCRAAGAMPCAGTGSYSLVLTGTGGLQVTGPATAFAFNEAALAQQAGGSACADVADAFKTGPGHVEGTLVAGTRPGGRICGSQSFTYTVRFGPFPKCGAFKVRARARAARVDLGGAGEGDSSTPVGQRGGCGLWRRQLASGPLDAAAVGVQEPHSPACGHDCTLVGPTSPQSDCPPTPPSQAVNVAGVAFNGTGGSASATSSLPVNVVGCNLYTDLARAADCVSPASYWAKCSLAGGADAKCSGGWSMLPGGKRRATPFFPRDGEDAGTARTYAMALVGGQAAGAGEGARAYASAAREYIAAQLNFLSGARLPAGELQDAYDALAAFLGSAVADGSGVDTEHVRAAEVVTGLLAQYNAGTLAASYGAPKRCAAAAA